MYIVFDTETNGLLKDYNAHPSNVDNFPRVIQLAYIIYNQDGSIRKEYEALIKPDGWKIPKEKFWIQHGYDTEKSLKRGIPMKWALDEFIIDLQSCEFMIAHNMNFDYRIIGAEMIRAKLSSPKKLERICTMKTSKPVLKLPSRGYGMYKSPNLTELHKYFFGEGFNGAHDALSDVRATGKCFFELKKISDIEWKK